MSLRMLSSLTAILAILIMAHPYQALASLGRRLAATTSDAAANTEPAAGICAAAEIMHGYKCQEYDVCWSYFNSLLYFL